MTGQLWNVPQDRDTLESYLADVEGLFQGEDFSGMCVSLAGSGGNPFLR